MVLIVFIVYSNARRCPAAKQGDDPCYKEFKNQTDVLCHELIFLICIKLVSRVVLL